MAAQQRSSSDGGISLGSDSSNRQVRDALKKVKTEVDRQSRTGAINDLIKGIVLAGLGGAIYAFHMARTDDGRRRKAAKRTGSTAATASAPNPPAVPVT